MKICHFISSKGLGRGEFYIDLVNEMSQNKDVKIKLLIPKDAKFLNRVSNRIDVIEYSSKDTRNNVFLYIELYRIFKLEKFDIVHTHFAKATEIFYKINKLLKIIHIGTKHNPRKGKIFNKLKYVTAVSIDVRKSIKNKSVKVINNGLKDIKLDKVVSTNKVFTIRAIGRLDKIKGFDILISKLSKLEEAYLLEIIGDGNEYDELSILIKRLNMEEKVKLVGFKTNIPDLIASSDLVIMTSISEGFSLVMLEAIFYSKLFISTKVSGCKDLLKEKFLMDHSNIDIKVSEVIKNYDEYSREFQDLSKELRNRYSLENITKQYFNYYNEVISNENRNN